MSETDDTDVLLLITPNFFLVPSSESENSLLESSRTVVHKPVTCTAQVLGKLVNQVHSLESRLEDLELDSTISANSHKKQNWASDSFENRSANGKCFTFPRRRRRKINKRHIGREASLTSLDTVGSRNKTVPSLNLGDSKRTLRLYETQSMDGDISSIVSTPSKKNDKLFLNEIDDFLTKVESYEAPETKAEIEETLHPDNVIKATGDYITNKYDPKKSPDNVVLPSGRTVSSNVLDKYIYLVKNHQSAVLPGRNKEQEPARSSEKQEIKSPSVRKLNFSDKDLQPTSTPKRQQSTSSYSEFRPSSNKVYDRATKIVEHYKSQNYSKEYPTSMTDSSNKEEFKMPQMRPFGYDTKEGLRMQFDSIDTDLLSLSELWGEKVERRERSDNIKLEEERLKREHCESMIQQLQRKILEQQEKLAVAMKVDKAKDAAITKLREAWLKLTNNLDKAEERHRNALERMTQEVDNFKLVAQDAQKKTNHFETELYKALDLAHDYQEKCKQLTAEKEELNQNMEKELNNRDELVKTKEREINVLKENCETVMRLNKQSTDCVRNVEEALDKEKLEHEMTRSKINELNSKMLQLEEAKSLVEQERNVLKEKVNEERSRCNILEHQLCDSQNQLSDLLRKCDSLDNEAKSLHKHLELQKTELKNHYQQQLEEAVLGKLQEFQRQLDLAERDMESASRTKEHAIVDTYNKQIARIEEQHRLEVNVLEEKQREEIKLCRLQLAQATEKIGLLESKLENYRRRRGQIASQLHSIMEAQWRQALQILTNGQNSSYRPPSEFERTDTVCTPYPQEYVPPKIPPLTMPPLEKLLRGSEQHAQAHTTHPNSRDINFEELSDNELQQYVKMLLTKPPNLDLSDHNIGRDRQCSEQPTSDRVDKMERFDRMDKKDKTKPHNSNKPPWKS
ncbi:unnamed protein product [Leptosia nina]|uniref:Centrobin n=1 Tax=Leptosia nina TaxID=320188 RepID=A0AAV1IY53_9NEOP